MASKQLSRIDEMIINNKKFSIMESIRKIDEMILLTKSDKTIDVNNLRLERRNLEITLKNVKKDYLSPVTKLKN
jgi:hypothetical protein